MRHRPPAPTGTPTAALAAGLLAVGLSLAVVPALAQPYPPPPVTDTVSLTLSVEDWVKTETALVLLQIDAAGSGEETAKLRDNIVAAAAKAAPQGDWRIVQLDRRQDEAGLDRWTAILEARLPETALGGLDERLRQASRVGLQVKLAEVAFDPTLAEVEATRAALRERLYRDVTAEVARLNGVLPDRGYRVVDISFQDGGPFPEPMPMARARMTMAGEAMAAPVQSGVQDKLVLTARVTLGAFATPPKP